MLNRLWLLCRGIPLKVLEMHIDPSAPPTVTNLTPLERFPELRSALRISAHCPSSVLTSLETLNMQLCRGWVSKRSRPAIRWRLDLSGTSVAGSLEPLSACTRLEELCLSYCQRIDGTLSPLCACSDLRVLNLEGCFAREVITYRESSTTVLRGLRGPLTPLSSLTKLQVCNLWGCELLAESPEESAGRGALGPLASCAIFEFLFFGAAVASSGHWPLDSCPMLTKLDASRCRG